MKSKARFGRALPCVSALRLRKMVKSFRIAASSTEGSGRQWTCGDASLNFAGSRSLKDARQLAKLEFLPVSTRDGGITMKGIGQPFGQLACR